MYRSPALLCFDLPTPCGLSRLGELSFVCFCFFLSLSVSLGINTRPILRHGIRRVRKNLLVNSLSSEIRPTPPHHLEKKATVGRGWPCGEGINMGGIAGISIMGSVHEHVSKPTETFATQQQKSDWDLPQQKKN